jgi:hypothetical protein
MKKPILAYVLDGLAAFAVFAMAVAVATMVFLDYTWSEQGPKTIFWGTVALALFTAGFIVKKLAVISKEKHPTEDESR